VIYRGGILPYDALIIATVPTIITLQSFRYNDRGTMAPSAGRQR
jgi:hypothetical protein